jgi:tungstate transport system substrate-binding protein
MKTAAEALKAIAAKQAPFISRGDKSGTHVAELGLWDGAGIKPSGPWYTVYEKGSEGNAPTLLFTDQKESYTVIDRPPCSPSRTRSGSWCSWKATRRS